MLCAVNQVKTKAGCVPYDDGLWAVKSMLKPVKLGRAKCVRRKTAVCSRKVFFKKAECVPVVPQSLGRANCVRG